MRQIWKRATERLGNERTAENEKKTATSKLLFYTNENVILIILSLLFYWYFVNRYQGQNTENISNLGATLILLNLKLSRKLFIKIEYLTNYGSITEVWY